MARSDKRERALSQQREWRKRAVARAGTTLCECGCGNEIPAVRSDGKTPRRFAIGHTSADPPRVAGQTRADERGYVLEFAGSSWVRQHRLVWERKHGPLGPGDDIHHKNGNKQDNRLSNLEVVTASDHAVQHWRERWADRKPQCTNIEHLRAEANPKASVTPEQVVEIRQRVAAGEMVKDVASDLGLPIPTVSRIWSGRTWACGICRGKPGRKRSAQPKKRVSRERGVSKTADIKLRVSPAEKLLIQEKAGGARKVSAYLRRLALEDGGSSRPAVRPEPGHVQPEHQAGPDRQRRVNEKATRMSRRNAEFDVSQEEAQERARAALGG